MSAPGGTATEPGASASRATVPVGRRRVRDAFGWLGVAVGVVGLAAREVPFVWQPAVLAATFSPYLALGGLLGGAVLGWDRQRIGMAVGATVVAATVAAHVPLFVATGDTAVAGPEITVLQANLRLGEADPTDLVARVRADRVDVLALEEVTDSALAGLSRAGLGNLLPYHFARPAGGGAGTGIWSRYPLRDTTEQDGFELSTLSATVEVEGARPTTVFAVHLTPPWPYASSTWKQQIDRLREALDTAARRGPVFAAGDFNSTLDQPTFRGLTSQYRDAADTTGAGWMPTYPADKPWPPLIGIDHVLTRDVEARSVRSVSLPGSDHRGLIARLRLPGP